MSEERPIEFWPTVLLIVFVLAIALINVFRRLMGKEPWRFRRHPFSALRRKKAT